MLLPVSLHIIRHTQFRLTRSNRGPVDTPMLRNSYEILGKEVDYSFLPLGRTANQKEIPATVEFLISDASSFITGVALPVDGGWFC